MKYRFLPVFLLGLCPSLALFGQPAITVSAREYNTSPEGTPLKHFDAHVQVQPPTGGAYTLSQTCDSAGLFGPFPLGSTLTISAEKTDEPDVEVHTYDLVLISKHIHHEVLLDHPSRLIAADADCNGVVENRDIVVLRSMILQKDTTICRSWTLLNAAVSLPEDPLQAPLPREIVVQDYDGQPLQFQFWAIKTGNVDAFFPIQRTPPPAGVFVAAPYPNPTSGPVHFTVQPDAPATLQLEVFDTGGRLVYQMRQPVQAGAQEFVLPADALPMPGIYFWRAVAGAGRAQGKLVRI